MIAALFVARVDPTTGLPSRIGEMTGFADLADARTRAASLANLQGHLGREVTYGVYRLDSEYTGEVTLAPAPSPKPTETQVQP